MKNKLIIVLSLCSLAVALAQQADKPTIKSKDGKFRVWGFLSTAVEFEQNGIKFNLRGNPVRGESTAQGLSFICQTLEGTAKNTKGGGMRLTNGTLSGGASVTLSQNDVGGNSKTTLKSSTIVLLDGEPSAELRLGSPFTVQSVQSGGGQSRTIDFAASSGTVLFDPLEKAKDDPVQSATMAGGVTARVQTVVAGQKNNVFTLKGARLTYTRSTRTMTVTGNVTLDGEEAPEQGPGFIGEMSGLHEVIVIFNHDNSLKQISAKGAPGEANLKQSDKDK